MKKGNAFWVIAIIAVFFVAGMYAQKNVYPLFSTVDIARSCDYAKLTITEGQAPVGEVTLPNAGAGLGECFVDSLGNTDRLAYVTKMYETSRPRTVSPAYPDGIEYMCHIDYCSSCWENIFKCDYAWKNGKKVKVCKYDSDCESGNCVNAMCKEGYTNDCTEPYEASTGIGETRCLSESQYQVCLPNYKWSGLLSCGSGSSCYVDSCKSQDEIDDINDPYCSAGQEKCSDGTCKDDCPGSPIPVYVYYIGAGAAALVVLSLLRR